MNGDSPAPQTNQSGSGPVDLTQLAYRLQSVTAPLSDFVASKPSRQIVQKEAQTYKGELSDDGVLIGRKRGGPQFMSTESTESVLQPTERVRTYAIHGRVRQFVSKVDKTYRICDLMARILRGEVTQTADFELSDAETRLLAHLLNRKYNNVNVEEQVAVDPFLRASGISIEDRKLRYFVDFMTAGDAKQRADTMKRVVDFTQLLKISKRVEENNKFIYKHTTSYLLSQFVTRNSLKFGPLTETAYYEHYFSEHAATVGVSVSDYCDPLKTTLKSTSKAKSLNTEYLTRILSCDKFRGDFFGYLERGFEDHYVSAIYKKMERMLGALEAQWSIASPERYGAILEEYVKNKINHRWCKIPWSKSEVGSAVRHFLKYFNNLLDRSSETTRRGAADRLPAPTLQPSAILSGDRCLDEKLLCSIEQRKSAVSIQTLGTILSHKKVKKHTLSLFEPSEICASRCHLNLRSDGF